MNHGLAAAFRGQRVLVLGDIMLDEYIWGEVRRISPEAPVPVVEMSRRTYVPGGASNTAANVAAWGDNRTFWAWWAKITTPTVCAKL